MNKLKVGDTIQQCDLDNISSIYHTINNIYKRCESDNTILLKMCNDLLSVYVNTISKCKNTLEDDSELNMMHIQTIISRTKDILQILSVSQQGRLEL